MSPGRGRVHPPLVTAASGAILALTLVAAAYAFRHTLSCFMLAFILAYLFDPLVVFMEKKGLSRNRGIVVLYIFLGIFSFFFVAFFVPFVTLRWESFVRDIPWYVQKTKEMMVSLRSGVEPAYGGEEWQWLFVKAAESLDKIIGKLGAGVYSTASRVVFNLINLLLAPILVFFMLYYKQDIIRSVVSWIPATRREVIVEIGSDINRSMGGFIRGQLAVSAIVALLSTVALFFLDIDYPLLNGLFAGLASILPFVGVILAMLPPLFFAYVKFQSGVVLAKVAIAFMIIYFFEGYLVKPLVFKESMDLNPLATILMVMAFGELMGFWGILLAIPITAAVKIFGQHYHRGDFAS